jgi:hypothetical protein
MRLSAQRVRAADGHQGVNAFCALHGSRVWLDQPPADVAASAGQLVNRRIQVVPGGNSVLRYLDIVAPDDTPSSKIERAITDSIDLLREQPLPLVVQSEEVRFEFNVDLRLASAWRRELVTLMRAALAVRTPEGTDVSEVDELA